MAEVAKKYQDELKRIKDNIEQSYLYFKDNYDRFNFFRKFVFQTSLTDEDIALLKELDKPQIEFNIQEAYISRLLGEFSKQEPSPIVSAKNTKEIDPQTPDLVESHLRASIEDCYTDNLQYEIYKDTLSGGFSVGKVFTDYDNELSFDQIIKIERSFDPTLCGFDPLARTSHKGDGRYCFEMYPKPREEFEREYGKELTKDMKFTRDEGSFNWSYTAAQEDVVVIVSYYEKKRKKTKIVKLANGKTMTAEKYKKLQAYWDEQGIIEQIPKIISTRSTMIETIVRYDIAENKVLSYQETDYKYLPLVFFDGNSIMLRQHVNGSAFQMTRPYIYHTKGTQKLKNFAGQTLANELENMVQHKFKVAKESIPSEYIDAYENVQKASVLIYNGFLENDPDKPLPPPQEIQRVATPPEVTNTFRMADEVTQSILGSYDAALGINNNQLSGVAIVEGATQSNSAAMPYVVNYLKGLNRILEIYVDLLPKYYVTPRTLPIRTQEGKREYVVINQGQNPSFDYDSSALNVKVEAGVNFMVQKSRALETVVALMKASPIFNQFINTKGLHVLLDNLDIRGIDSIRKEAETYMQELQQQQQMAQQQPNPLQLKAQAEQQKSQMQMQELTMKNQIAQSQLQLDMAKLHQDEMKIMADLKKAQDSTQVQTLKAETERFAKTIDLAIKHNNSHQGEQNG